MSQSRLTPRESGRIVYINTSRFDPGPQYSNSATFELAYSTDSTEELLAWAFRGLDQIYRTGYHYKKAGVMLKRLTPAERLSARLFGDERFEKSRRVMKAEGRRRDQRAARAGYNSLRCRRARR